GKVGWWRMLLLYLAIGVVDGLLVQVAMLGGGSSPLSPMGPQGAGGASSAIFGLMAVCMIWAPQNHAKMVFVYYVYVREFEAPYWGLAFFYIGLDLLLAAIGGFEIGTSMLHLSGALVGLAMGVAMLKLDWVDCERWDLLSLWAGRDMESFSADERRQREQRQRESIDQRREHLVSQIEAHLAEQRPDLAEIGRRLLGKVDPAYALPEATL